MKIKQVAEDIRAMAMRNDWCVISATQTRRSGIGKSDMSMNDVSESHALAATVDVMMGIIQDSVLKMNNSLLLKFILNRMGEQDFRKKYLMDYKFMRITETNEPETVPDLT